MTDRNCGFYFEQCRRLVSFIDREIWCIGIFVIFGITLRLMARSQMNFDLSEVSAKGNDKAQIHMGSITRYKVGRHELSLSHLLNADDGLIFTKGSEKSLRNLMNLIRVYELSSGQLVNSSKSGFYLADKFQHRVSVISRIKGMTRGDLPFHYLGVPITNGRVKNIHYDHLIDKTRRAVDGCKAKILSLGCRLTLIKLVLGSYPIYTLSSTIVPKTVIRNIERILSSFLWDIQGTSRAHCIWEKCMQSD